MGFTTILAIIYVVLFFIEISAFIIGKKSNEWALFIGMTAFLIIGTSMLAYLWIKSPM